MVHGSPDMFIIYGNPSWSASTSKQLLCLFFLLFPAICPKQHRLLPFSNFDISQEIKNLIKLKNCSKNEPVKKRRKWPRFLGLETRSMFESRRKQVGCTANRPRAPFFNTTNSLSWLWLNEWTTSWKRWAASLTTHKHMVSAAEVNSPGRSGGGGCRYAHVWVNIKITWNTSKQPSLKRVFKSFS